MKFIVGEGVTAKMGLCWVKDALLRFDTSNVNWIRFDLGKQRDKAVGDCLFPTAELDYRLAGRFPNSFPLAVRLHLPPRYLDSPGAKELQNPKVIQNEVTGKNWIRQYGSMELENQDQAVVWTFGQAAYRWLLGTGQLAGRDNKIEIDRFAGIMLSKYETECGISV